MFTSIYSTTKRWLVLSLVIGLILVLALSGIAYAQNNNTTYYACINNSSGTIRVYMQPTTCSNNETAIMFNQTGPAGPQGPAGADGATGPQGPQGESGSGGGSNCDLERRIWEAFPHENPFNPDHFPFDVSPACYDSFLDGDLDGDGLSGAQESDAGTNPSNPDTDGDYLDDFIEVELGYNPLDPDPDHDGLNDYTEQNIPSDPFNPDTDGDGWLDGNDIGPVGLLCVIDPNCHP